MAKVNELIMIIPVILNLKGNLEMNLSARLGTAANIGELDKPKVRRALIIGNLTLLQVQATVVSFVAALVSFGLGRVMPTPEPQEPTTDDSGITLFTRRPRPSPFAKSDPGGWTE